MTSYSDQLAQRKQAAAKAEATLVAHFGPEAENCANWDELWQRGWREVLTNPTPSPTYRPKGLPHDGEGGWVSEDGRRAGAYPPDIYSDKFLFYLAKQLFDDEVTVAARIADWLEDADEIDCDQLSAVVGKLTTYLANYHLYHVSGTGQTVDMGLLDTERMEAFFQNSHSIKNVTAVFISRPGIAIANRRPVPAVVASSILQAIRRQIEARQQQLQAGVFIRSPKEQEGKISLPTLALILIYERQTLQRGEKANSLARNAGHASGDRLYNAYCKYSASNDRLGFDNDTASKGRNMIGRIQAALPHLTTEAKQRAENEISIIEARIS
jgi:hypothetical protein